MADLNRVEAGLQCREVLELLSEYIDGDLSPDMVARVDGHVRACTNCERFGGKFAGLVAQLRREPAFEGLGASVRRDLVERMRSEWSEEDPTH